MSLVIGADLCCWVLGLRLADFGQEHCRLSPLSSCRSRS